MDKQKTLKNKVSFEGVGIHFGKHTHMDILPAGVNSGISFSRRDIPESPVIKACSANVLAADKFPRRTSLGIGSAHIYTVEHLMAAFNILGVDNALVEIWAEEIPSLDGSAKDFVEKIREAGLEQQDCPRNYIVIREPIHMQNGSSSIMILPSAESKFSYALKYEHPVIGSGYAEVVINDELKDDFYQARTFCLEEEVKQIKDIGLGKGSNYSNALVVSQTGVIGNKLRFPDEFAKHKLLDLVGDLYLEGPIKGSVLAIKSGHTGNTKMLAKIAALRSASVKATLPANELAVLDINQIMEILPHRYPFLLVDKIISLEKGKKAVGIKNVTRNEEFFQGHFPARPVMPGVLMIEAMAQVGGIIMLAGDERKGKLAFFMSADKVKFRKTVEPGDQLRIEAEIVKIRSRTCAITAKTYVGDKLVTEAELMFALVE
jgi:UDP-3-O-[3-hydroxymyristoyl] N-acetylglucosamine deacetylase/3-hydroxyacyl-[acyl-carrier-protein] dehydratase